MSYLIAKKYNRQGCWAVRVPTDKATASLVSYLGLKALPYDIQILAVSNMDIYGEYKPYTLVESEKEFITIVLDMVRKEEFIEKYCRTCGTQRCEGVDTEWAEGCVHYREHFQNEVQNKNDKCEGEYRL